MIDRARARSFTSARAVLGISAGELWMSYLGLGGDLPFAQVEAFLDGRAAIGSADYDRLAQVVNESLMDTGDVRSVPYAEEMDGPQEA